MTNKVSHPDYSVIDSIIGLMWNQGFEPFVKTHFTINKKMVNEFFTKN